MIAGGVPVGAASTSGVSGSAAVVGGGVGAGAGGFAGARCVVALGVVGRGLGARGVARGAAGFAAAGFDTVRFGAAGFAAADFAAAGFAAAGFAAADFAAAGFAAADFGSGGGGAVVREVGARGAGDFRTRGVGAGGVIGGSKSSSEGEAAAAPLGFRSGSKSTSQPYQCRLGCPCQNPAPHYELKTSCNDLCAKLAPKGRVREHNEVSRQHSGD